MSAKWNAATRYSAHPFTTKTGARVHFFCLNYPRIRGWYQARVHPFSSGNGKGDFTTITIELTRHVYLHTERYGTGWQLMLSCIPHSRKVPFS